MSEITKLYENAEIEKRLLCGNRDVLCGHVRPDGKSRLAFGCFGCEYKNDMYPPFTAKKQIELIKWLLENYEGIDINKRINRFNFLVDNATFIGCHHNDKSFEESLAGVINKLWTDMAEEQQQQVKGILE